MWYYSSDRSSKQEAIIKKVHSDIVPVFYTLAFKDETIPEKQTEGFRLEPIP